VHSKPRNLHLYHSLFQRHVEHLNSGKLTTGASLITQHQLILSHQQPTLVITMTDSLPRGILGGRRLRALMGWTPKIAVGISGSNVLSPKYRSQWETDIMTILPGDCHIPGMNQTETFDPSPGPRSRPLVIGGIWRSKRHAVTLIGKRPETPERSDIDRMAIIVRYSTPRTTISTSTPREPTRSRRDSFKRSQKFNSLHKSAIS
jgi:hypothetical protein